MKTVNRGWLKKQILKGVVKGSCDYSLTDDYGFDNSNNFGKTSILMCRLKKDFRDFVEDYINFDEFDLKTKSGKAYYNYDGSISLSVHSNLSYTLILTEV